MTYQAKYPAAFINVIHEEGTKAEAVEWLQRTWDELQDLRQELRCERTAFVHGETRRCVLRDGHVGAHRCEHHGGVPFLWMG